MNLKNPLCQIKPDRRYFAHGRHLPLERSSRPLFHYGAGRGSHYLIKLNAVDPFAYLSATLTRLVNGHKQSRIDELMPGITRSVHTAEVPCRPEAGLRVGKRRALV
ncbi:transposase domain-containing protein [Rhizobium sp. BK008]|uniref:transposase domain-containing protein n=1 Tax=Rhizobium sp. BK008 TaxID=2587094 RepID=UPI003917BB48